MSIVVPLLLIWYYGKVKQKVGTASKSIKAAHQTNGGNQDKFAEGFHMKTLWLVVFFT
jgi:hypothetical protein